MSNGYYADMQFIGKRDIILDFFVYYSSKQLIGISQEKSYKKLK